MYIIGYDAAIKSLAVSIIKFNENWRHDLNNIMITFKSNNLENYTPGQICQNALDAINKISDLLDSLITPIFLDVTDLIPGKKIKDVTPLLKARRLKGYLSYIDNTYLKNIQCYKVLIEYQMGPNFKSNSIGAQILYHYAKESNALNESNEVEIIGPSLKNKLNFDKIHTYEFFIKKYAKSYTANKKHTEANMLFWLKKYNFYHLLDNIKSKNKLDDIADAFLMDLAWLFLKSDLI